MLIINSYGSTVISAGIHPADEEIPEHVPFILIGAGTASFAAYRAIKKEKPDAKVHLHPSEK